jgi:hypothetical protein
VHLPTLSVPLRFSCEIFELWYRYIDSLPERVLNILVLFSLRPRAYISAMYILEEYRFQSLNTNRLMPESRTSFSIPLHYS